MSRMRMKVESHWIRFSRPHDPNIFTGKWVAFFRSNFSGISKVQRDAWISSFRTKINELDISEVLLKKNNLISRYF